jgi:hypothetical protein
MLCDAMHGPSQDSNKKTIQILEGINNYYNDGKSLERKPMTCGKEHFPTTKEQKYDL